MNSIACKEAAALLSAHVDGTLPEGDAEAVESHLLSCAACQENARKLRAVHGLLGYMQAQPENGNPADSAVQAEIDAVTAELNDPHDVPEEELVGASADGGSHWGTLAGAAPWWFVSVALHVLAIMLAGLLAVERGGPAAAVVINVTEVGHPSKEPVEPPKSENLTHALKPASPIEIRATDPDAFDFSEILVSPDVLAELGDHFETDNPEMVDTGGALGNLAASMFYSATGDSSEAGGGMGGLADVIGVDGTAGTGTGWGGTGLGLGPGGGTGSFSKRTSAGRRTMVPRHKGIPAGEAAVERGLAWLARNQDAEGYWDASKFEGGSRKGGPNEVNIAVTGFALLAFLGAGHTEKVGKYQQNVEKGIYWLKKIQQADGKLTSNYGHSIAGMALAEAAAMANVPETKAAAQKALDCTSGKGARDVEENSERYGWSYAVTQLTRLGGDLSNTGWTIMFLKSSKVAGLKVNPFTWQGAINFLDACEVGRKPGDPYSGHRYTYRPNQGAGGNPKEQITLVGILNRQFMGVNKHELQQAAEWAAKAAELNATTNMYFTYYGTLVCFQQGGPLWETWNKAMLEKLLPSQRTGGEEDGSWDPRRAYSDVWGRVGQTALSILCLEVYYRYEVLKN